MSKICHELKHITHNLAKNTTVFAVTLFSIWHVMSSPCDNSRGNIIFLLLNAEKMFYYLQDQHTTVTTDSNLEAR